jgi:hypothetical protein
MAAVFEADLPAAGPYSFARWKSRPLPDPEGTRFGRRIGERYDFRIAPDNCYLHSGRHI